MALLLGGCGDLPADATNVQSNFKLARKPTLSSYQVGGRTIAFAQTGASLGPLILFVHGSPGDWRAFEHFLNDGELKSRAQLIAVDRPGFGNSGFGQPEPSLQRQAALLKPLLDRFGAGRQTILVGHSLGGSVIARMAMDFRDQVGALLLVSPAIDPEVEELRWYNRLAALAPIRLLLPASLDISNREILPLRGELQKMLPLWERVKARVVVIQGKKDRLVSPRNADFAEKVVRRDRLEVQRIPDAGHFVLWERPNLIRAALLRLLDKSDGTRLSGVEG